MANDRTGILGMDLLFDIPGEGDYDHYYHFWVIRKGAWALTTSYAVNDLAHNDSGTYLCKLAHTSTTQDEPGTGENWQTNWRLIIANEKITHAPRVQKLWHYGKYMAFAIGNVGNVDGKDVWVMVS